MPDTLPKGWIRTTVGSVCSRAETIRPEDTPDEEFTYFDIGGIDNKRHEIAATKTIAGRSAPSRARLAARKDDILFSTVRTYLKNIARIEHDYPNPVASTGFAVLRPADGIVPQFVFYQVLWDAFLEPLSALQSGSSYPAVRERDVFAQAFLLPPTAEQTRIVAKLDASLSRIQRAEAAARRALSRLHRYRAAVFNAAVRGELTRDWRKAQLNSKKGKPESGDALLQQLLNRRRLHQEEMEAKRPGAKGKVFGRDTSKSRTREPAPPTTDGLPNLPRGWTWASIDQLSWASSYGTSTKCSYQNNGPPVLRIPNVQNRTIDCEDLKFATRSHKFKEADFIAPGDLLVIRTNGSKDLVGRAAVVTIAPKERCTFASYLIRFRLLAPETIWSWVSLAWDSDILRTGIESRAVTTAGQYNVSLSRLADLAIPLAPGRERAEIIAEAERRLFAADHLASTIEQQLALSQTTRESLLREAFAGRLIAQNPKDESASVLLERIHSSREAKARIPRGKAVKSKSGSKTKRRPLLDVLAEQTKPMTPEQLFREAGFEASQVDQFYRELCLLREKLKEQKPKASETKSWPMRAHVLLQLKEDRDK